MTPAIRARREGRTIRPAARCVISARNGRAKASRQKPAAAGPVWVSLTKIGEKPITQAPNTSTATARQRGVSTVSIRWASVKAQLRAQRLGGHAAGAQLAQRFRPVALGVALAVRPGQQPMMAIGRR